MDRQRFTRAAALGLLIAWTALACSAESPEAGAVSGSGANVGSGGLGVAGELGGGGLSLAGAPPVSLGGSGGAVAGAGGQSGSPPAGGDAGAAGTGTGGQSGAGTGGAGSGGAPAGGSGGTGGVGVGGAGTGGAPPVGCEPPLANCDANPDCEVNHAQLTNACGSPTSVGSACGDTACGFWCDWSSWSTFKAYTGTRSHWFRARALECSSCCANVQARVILDVPAAVNYDLYIYSSCSNLVASSKKAAGEAESLTVYAYDNCGATADSFDYWVEVRWVSGSSCSPWTIYFRQSSC